MDYCKIGQKIRKYRKAKGMSQEELAEAVGISVTHMSHIETGNTKLSLPVFVSLVNALEIRSDDILYDDGGKIESLNSELASILESCTAEQMRIITDVARAVKISLDKHI